MSVGVVVIGRNEGERLRVCLQSLASGAERIVYVDSGSTDGSVAMAKSMGVDVVELDMSIPFTAGRARNEGFHRLGSVLPEVDYVQFVDGDCEIAAGWLVAGVGYLDGHPDAAIACGRQRERYPERTVYNLLFDIEWNAPVGESKACTGNAMIRADAFEAVRGFRPDLIAGEDPELCLRLRAAGWRIWRLPDEMALHDADMTRFDQWWKRSVRSGYAFAEGAFLHGRPPERHWVRESRSAWVWGFGIPMIALAATLLLGPWGLSLLAVYPLQVARLFVRCGGDRRARGARALFLVLGKFPELAGQFKFLARRMTGGTAHLIEYK